MNEVWPSVIYLWLFIFIVNNLMGKNEKKNVEEESV